MPGAGEKRVEVHVSNTLGVNGAGFDWLDSRLQSTLQVKAPGSNSGNSVDGDRVDFS
jgi:hypothetical protein